ncbi:MAG: leucyl/phenylalanyl-tRNA--protein transferase [Daejeonella sp.]
MVYQLDAEDIWFPKPELADEDGLLAVGGDLSPERLVLAYHYGIFPWFSDASPILWYAPLERFVLYPQKIKISKSMRQVMRSNKLSVTKNKDFEAVIKACASAERKDLPGTWITDMMIEAYLKLHQLDMAHSYEVWQNDVLVGGLYGVLVNGVFCGESMFSLVSNASKLALIYVSQESNLELIDCQMHTAHLESMGGEYISQSEYLSVLQKI